MLLTIDAGNSSISLGLFDLPNPTAPDRTSSSIRPSLRWNAKIAADIHRSADEYRVVLALLLRESGFNSSDIRAVALGSVVPALSHTLREAVDRLCRHPDGTSVPIRTVGTGTRTGLILHVDDPAQLGADIVANAAAAVWLYGAPVTILDIGTATVLSCVDGNRTLLGVSIAPGPQTSLDGLRGAAALIPHVELRSPGGILGRNTADSVCAGVIYGTAAMADGLIRHTLREAQLPPDTPVVATGGLVSLVLPFCRCRMNCEDALTLYGLYRIFDLTARREAQRQK